MSKKNKQIIVLGIHRAGTSCVAGILKHLSVFMGYNLLEASESNPKGHFEDKDFMVLNNDIIGSWDNPIPEPKIQTLNRIKNLIEQRDSEFDLWGAKDPRFCFTLKYFIDQLSNPFIIEVRRNINSSIASLQKREKISFIKAKTIQEKHELSKQEFIKKYGEKINFLSVKYENLLINTRQEIERIALFLDFNPLIEPAIHFIKKAEDFVEPSLNHNIPAGF